MKKNQYNHYHRGKPMCGTLLILLGASYILGILFGVNIPVFRILAGLVLLYLGIQIITGFPKRSCTWHCWSSYSGKEQCYSSFMGDTDISLDNETIRGGKSLSQYRTVFGKTTIDLSHITIDEIKATGEPCIVNIDTVFGKTELTINRTIPTRIIAKSAFGKVSLPDETSITFGTYTYNSHHNEPALMIIQTSTVFGETEIKSN